MHAVHPRIADRWEEHTREGAELPEHVKEKVSYQLAGHEELTDRALAVAAKRGARFTPEQRDMLVHANKGVDLRSAKTLFGILPDKYSAYHYHKGEEQQSAKIVDRLVDKAVRSDNERSAFRNLGEALHVAQDQHSHSVNDVKPGIKGLIKHLPLVGNNPDSIKAYPDNAKRAVEDSANLLVRFHKEKLSGALPGLLEKQSMWSGFFDEMSSIIGS